jgi:hypothetical protein
MQTWLEGPEAAGFFRVTRWVIDAEAWRERLGFHGGEQKTNSEIIAETFGSAGAYVMGRRMADGGEIPWGEDPRSVPRCPWSPTGPGRRCKGGAAPASPTSPPGSKCHRPSPGRRGREERGDRGRRHTLRQVIQLGLLDELELHIVPVILGDGMRFARPRPPSGQHRSDRAHPRPRDRHPRRHAHPLQDRRPASARPRQQGTGRGAHHRLARAANHQPTRAISVARAAPHSQQFSPGVQVRAAWPAAGHGSSRRAGGGRGRPDGGGARRR